MTLGAGKDNHRPSGASPRVIFALVAAVLVSSAVGFYPSYIRQFPTFATSGWQVHFHIATVLGWLALLIAQATLAGTGRIERHRALGRLSYALVPLIVLGFVLVAWFGQRRNPNPALLGATFFDGGLFLLFYVLAILKRRRPNDHGRYMLLTGVTFINPSLGRAVAPQLSVPLEFALIVGLLIAARRRGERWQPYAVGAIAYVVLLATIMIVNPPA